MYNQVVKFNQDILHIAPRAHGLPISDEFELTAHQLHEEASEYQHACWNSDYVGAIDACIDSIFFAIGALYKLGITEEEFNTIFKAVTNCNMTKTKGVKSGREGFDAADAIKPSDWVSPEERIMEILSCTE
jgi:predicted HAD superfamily Cof-like phosphohydrolase